MTNTKTRISKTPEPRQTHLAFRAQKLIQGLAFAAAFVALTLASAAQIPIPAGVTQSEAAFVIAASLTAPGHAVYEKTIADAAVSRQLASTLKAYNDGKDSGKVRLVNASTINVHRNIHYVKVPIGHGIDPGLWDYVIEGNSITHRIKAGKKSKRVLALIDSFDSQIKMNLTLFAAAKGGSPSRVTAATPAPATSASAYAAPAPTATALRAPAGNGLSIAYNPATPDSVVADAIRTSAKTRGWTAVSETPGSMRLEHKGYTLGVSYGGGAILIDHNKKTEGWAKGLQTLIQKKLPR